MDFSTSLSQVKYIGKNSVELLNSYELYTAADLANNFPYAYEDTTNILSVKQLYEKWRAMPVWELPTERFTVKVVVDKVSAFRTRRGMYIIKAVLHGKEDNIQMGAIWFNQTFVTRALLEGIEYLFFGKVQQDGGKLVIQSPRFEELSEEKPLVHLGRVTPIYHRMKRLTSPYIRRFMSELKPCFDSLYEYIPEDVLKAESLCTISEAYTKLHFPGSVEEPVVGRKRLEVQEILEIKARLDMTKAARKQQMSVMGAEKGSLIAKKIGDYISKLPYQLTTSQEESISHVLTQIAEGKKVDSFIYGDVGSGKTIIALLLAFSLGEIGYSTILMAPTTILAAQHVKTAEALQKLFASSIDIVPVLSGRKGLAQKAPAIFIGTHALLFAPDILKKKDLALVVIDEQHRFGVEQRKQLAEIESAPHVLTLSATPIPRTLALSFLGFSDAYFIKEKPKNRKEIITKLVPSDKLEVTYEWFRKRILEKDEQVFMVFPRIVAEDESDKQSVLAMKEALDAKYFKDISTGVLYGEMSEKEKSEIMEKFREGEIKILYSTTVIEVGVDVPNATVMAIHGAEMFGMAQLHQLRGRVGRSDLQGYCFLFTDSDVDTVQKRLEFFCDHSDGISLAEFDLKSRGSGQLTGQLQSGMSELKIADLSNLSLIQSAMNVYESLQKQGIAIPAYVQVKSTREEQI